MDKFIQPFSIGDVVRVVGKEVTGASFCNGKKIDLYSSWKIGTVGVVSTVQIDGVNEYSYATTFGAWLGHDILELVRECDVNSIKELMQDEEEEAD